MSNQLESLQKKLQTAIKNRQQVENTRISQLSTLTQFVAKLSLVCKGQDLKLDNKLAKFRTLLAKGVDFEILSPLIADVSELLKQQEAIQDQNIRLLQQNVTDAGSRLQKSKGVPSDLRRSLRKLLSSDIDDIKTTSDFVPILSQLVDIYHQVLNNKHGDISQSPSQISPELAQELLNLTSELAFEGKDAKKIDTIKAQITQNNQLDALLNACVAIIRIIVESISKERRSAQGFLLTVNDTLTLIHTSLIESAKRSKKVNHKMVKLNEAIENKINELNSDTEKATNIKDLKEIVGQKLQALTIDIKYKENLELQERVTLSNNIKAMKEQIHVLEQETETYKQRFAEQQFKSLRDSLTKLPNRSAYDERAELEYNAFLRNNSNLCLVVIDIDHFKSINDNFGHSAGDKTLQVIANGLKKSIRVTDFIARFGGEEFILIMPNTSIADVKQPLEKIRKNIKAIPFKFKNNNVTITISIGVAQFTKNETLLEIFDRADAALYQAKNNGRDQVIISR